MSDPDGLSPERIEQTMRESVERIVQGLRDTLAIYKGWADQYPNQPIVEISVEELQDYLAVIAQQRDLLKRLRQYFFVRPERRSFVRLIDVVIGPDAALESVKEQFSRD